MPTLSYRRAELVLHKAGGQVSKRQTRNPQRDLRRLGYFRRSIDGKFGEGTDQAVKALPTCVEV